MATYTSGQAKRPAAGVYHAAGVAKGGQQGKILKGTFTKSFTPASGASKSMIGATKSASGLAAPAPVAAAQWAPIPRPAPAVAAGVADPTDPFGLQRDSTYWDNIREGTRGFEDTVNPLKSELAGLQSRGSLTGKTLYEEMYGKAQSDFTNSVRDSRHEASRQGLLRSGAYDRTAGDLSSTWLTQQQGLDKQYGAGRITDLNTQIGTAQASLDEQKRLMALSAAARLQEQQAAANAAAYGQTIMPSGS